MPRSRGPALRALSAVLAVLALLAAPAVPGAASSRVLAHAQLVASSPGAGSSIESAPDELRLVFSEPLEEQVTSLDLVDASGELILDRAGRVDPADRYALVVDGEEITGLKDGVYTVTWRTLSAADGHTAEGVFSFGIGAAADATPATPGMTHTAASPIDVAGRWLTYLGLLLAFGVAATHRVVVGGRPMPRALVRLLGIGLLISAGATLLVGLANAVEAGGGVTEYLVGSRTGILHLARAAVAVIGAGVLLAGAGQSARPVAAATGLVGIGLLVASGHAAALPGPVALLSQAVHVAAAGVWVGGLAVLLTASTRPALVLGTEAAPSMRSLVPGFSALALVAIGLVGLTGIYSGWSQTGALVEPDTEYGRRLLLKSLVAVTAIALGGLNFLDGGRMRAWLAGMRARLTMEAGLATLVLLLTASLATTPPVDEAGGVRIAPVPDAFGATAPGMTLRLSPGRPGVNRVVVTTTDAMAMISGGLELVLDRVDTGTTTRLPLTLAPDAMAGHGGMDHPGSEVRGSDSPVDWIADAVVLPAGGAWDASVLAVATGGSELARQRFSFALSDDGIAHGAIRSIADPVTAVAALLLIGGALGIGVGLGGGGLPRCDPAASGVALRVGGLTAIGLGTAIGLDRLLNL